MLKEPFLFDHINWVHFEPQMISGVKKVNINSTVVQ